MGGAQVRPMGTERPTSGQPEVDVRMVLREIPPAIERLLDEFDAAGVDRNLRRAPSSQLHALDRGLPRQSLDDLLAACEAFALVTAPSALAAGDEAKVCTEAKRLASTLETLLRAGTRRRGLSRSTTASTSMQAPLLRAALEERPAQDALQDLIGIFGLLAAAEGGTRPRKRALSRLLPLGGRFLMPGSVLVTALVLIVLLLGSIAFATGSVTVSPGGIGLGGLNGGAQPTATNASSTNIVRAPTATPHSAPTATPSAHGTATLTPGSRSTPTPGGKPTLTVSPLNQDPCPGGSSATFTIAYSAGQGSVTWTASPDNASNMRLSRDGAAWSAQVSGTLPQAGQQTTIYVQGLNVDVTGLISVSANNGLTYPVSYDTTGC